METPSHYGKPQQYHGSLREKIPAHMIIPRKFPIIPRKLEREDTGTYDDTTEASDNTTTCFHTMDCKDCCCIPQPVTIEWIVEKGGYNSPNSMIQDIMAFSHGKQT